MPKKTFNEPLNKSNDDISQAINNAIRPSKETKQDNDFYLYHDLLKKSQSTNRLDNKEIDDLLMKLKQIDYEGMKIVYVLIRMYSLKTHTSKMFDLPYNCKKIKEYNDQCDIEFDLKNIPNTLQRMLLLFCDMHLDHMKATSFRPQHSTIAKTKTSQSFSSW